MAYDPTATHLSEGNYRAVKEYWEKYPKDQDKSKGRCNWSMFGNSIKDKIDVMENTMYVERSKERIKRMKLSIELDFSREIQFVYDYRSAISKDPNSSLTSCELFHWMKEKNENIYNSFKKLLSEVLNEIKSKPEAIVKDKIVWMISYTLGTKFIRL